MEFRLQSPFKPTGDQPEAIEQLVEGIRKGYRDQVLLGATATGKTFTMANVITQLNMPALVMAHNKTLAAQLYSEFKEFFPENSVEYFVSYYDYYQPEAYVPRHDLYIEKETEINEEIERMRLSATTALMDGGNGLGFVAAHRAMELSIAKAQQHAAQPGNRVGQPGGCHTRFPAVAGASLISPLRMACSSRSDTAIPSRARCSRRASSSGIGSTAGAAAARFPSSLTG